MDVMVARRTASSRRRGAPRSYLHDDPCQSVDEEPVVTVIAFDVNETLHHGALDAPFEDLLVAPAFGRCGSRRCCNCPSSVD
jgi:hypothetical protein